MKKLLVLLLSFAAVVPMPASQAAEVPIQPGARIRFGNGWCTTNFVFEELDKLYIGTAGHCVGVGAIVSDDDRTPIGKVVYSVNAYPNLDFALIEIYGHRYDDVSPAMRHWGGPTGVAATGPATGGSTPPGTVVRQHGYGTTFQGDALTRRRTGVLSGFPSTTFDAALPCAGGDSGSGVILASGEALGVLDVATLALGGLHQELGNLIGKTSPTCAGSTISHVLWRLRNGGFPGIELVTAPLAS